MGHRALVVEDDFTLGEVLRKKLEREGHEVVVATNQRDAYHLLDDREFDFVLLDLRLPTHEGDMDPHSQVGFDILDHIRDRLTQDELPVIVMTAYEESSQTAVRALSALANDYITKPFEDSPVSLDEKLASIGRTIEERRRASNSNVPSAKKHSIVFTRERVDIDGIPVGQRRVADLLRLLGSRTLMLSRDVEAGADVHMTGKEIARALDVQEATVRQYVTRFRKWIAAEYESRNLGPIESDEIIRNCRDWKGYELNFTTCSIRSG
jgi:DNA-binding response OmpR family regulator